MQKYTQQTFLYTDCLHRLTAFTDCLHRLFTNTEQTVYTGVLYIAKYKHGRVNV